MKSHYYKDESGKQKYMNPYTLLKEALCTLTNRHLFSSDSSNSPHLCGYVQRLNSRVSEPQHPVSQRLNVYSV